MGLLEDFPENPFIPTLRYAACQLAPLRLACGNNPIRLGSTLSVSYDKNAKSSLNNASAFAESSLSQSRIIFSSGSGGSIKQESSSSASSRQTDMSFSIHGEIGGDMLGAEVQLNYEKHTADSASDIRASFKSSYQSGRAMFAEVPQLSAKAIDILMKSKDPQKAFREAYGDYYVAAYILGASNANMLSAQASASSSSEGIDGQVKIKVLFIKITVGFSHHESSFHSMSTAYISAYDSLDNWGCNRAVTDAGGYKEVLAISAKNGANSVSIAHRVTERLEQLELIPGKEVPWSRCEEMFRKGVVTELLLLPYAKLRQYNEALLAGFAKGSSLMT